ncbi:ABC transporter permease [Hoylesella marshii]|uniref:ABC transporter permease n=1 Tax=Hoylesella marshii TaxID=189722 RepID=UPI0028D5A9EB|nr:ABC transporter permease [Hoylesella marshii]
MYLFCMVIFPVFIIFFFTSLLNEGLPEKMPVGVVDLDDTPTTRSMIRKLNTFQATDVVAKYASVSDARTAMQRNEIYAFLYIPQRMTEDLLASRQPKISFYYSNVSITAGSLLFRDLKTISLLGSAAVSSSVMSAKGYTEKQIRTFLQPVTIDLHQIGNPWANYNIYLSTMLIPGILMLFIFLVTAYSLGTELKFGRAKEWIAMSGDNLFVALAGKLLPQFLVFSVVTFGYMFYVFDLLNFPHPGGIGVLMLLGLLSVIASQGLGVFMFGLTPSLRMSMSLCSLWGVVSFSICGATFPVFSMDSSLEVLSFLFPLRHYYMIYQICIFNGFPLSDAWTNILSLMVFSCLPLFIASRLKMAMQQFTYIP